MPRKLVEAREYYRRVAAAEVADWTTPKRAAKKRSSFWNREAAQREVEAFIKTRDWKGASPRHFVELYARCHQEVYGVEALELRARKTAMNSAALAKRCLEKNFAGDRGALADFVSWVWYRERIDERKRRAGVIERDFAVSCRYQWSDRLVTQYHRAILTQRDDKPEKSAKPARS